MGVSVDGISERHLHNCNLGLERRRQLAIYSQQVPHGALVQLLHALLSCMSQAHSQAHPSALPSLNRLSTCHCVIARRT